MHHLVLTADTGEIFFDLIVPEVVAEGESFTPSIRASHEVIAEFVVFTGDGLAVSPEDFRFNPEFVTFSPRHLIFNASAPVKIFEDNEIETDEQFTVNVALVSALSFEPTVKINKPSATVNILASSPGECDVIS